MPGNVDDKIDRVVWVAAHVPRPSPSERHQSLQPEQSAEDLLAESAEEAARNFVVESVAARGVINGKLPRDGLETQNSDELSCEDRCEAFTTHLIAVFYALIKH